MALLERFEKIVSDQGQLRIVEVRRKFVLRLFTSTTVYKARPSLRHSYHLSSLVLHVNHQYSGWSRAQPWRV